MGFRFSGDANMPADSFAGGVFFVEGNIRI
jgi:hypothetical protein